VGAEKETPTSLADIAFALLRTLNDPRPIHARQITAMALKRKLVAGDPEEMFRALRAALLDDARARQGRGLRPRVRHHGGSLFAIATSRLDADLARVEDELARRSADLADATRAAMRKRLAELPASAFEQLARVWLERTGWREVAHVKRHEVTTYLSARTRQGAIPMRILVGVRAGGEDVGRRSIGELRAGVQAKQSDQGLLVAAGRINADGEREVRSGGPPVTVLDGDAFAEELIRAGVGVMRVAMPVAYLDADFFAELVQS
jgi:restriction endonuclease Mrr